VTLLPGRRASRAACRLVRVWAIALALVVPAASGAAAEQPFETLRLTRLGGSDPAAEFSVSTPDGSPLALGALRGRSCS
jgi:hypothetical protein